MNIAVPVWQGRVSPLFDTAQNILLADVVDGEIGDRRLIGLPNDTFKECVRFLSEQKVHVLICGAVSQPLAKIVGTNGIVLIPWIAGSIEDVLQAFLEGHLGDVRFNMPGSVHIDRYRLQPVYDQPEMGRKQ